MENTTSIQRTDKSSWQGKPVAAFDEAWRWVQSATCMYQLWRYKSILRVVGLALGIEEYQVLYRSYHSINGHSIEKDGAYGA